MARVTMTNALSCHKHKHNSGGVKENTMKVDRLGLGHAALPKGVVQTPPTGGEASHYLGPEPTVLGEDEFVF